LNKYKLKPNIKTVLIRRYILIFTLALISCAATNYIHSLSVEKNNGNSELVEQADKDTNMEKANESSNSKINDKINIQ